MTRNFLHFDGPTPSTHVAARGDTGTPLSFVLGDLDGPWDLTGATLLFFYKTSLDLHRKLDVVPDPDQVANRGRASGFWGANELTSVETGNFPCQVEVIFPGNRVRFAPERPLTTLVISAPLLGSGGSSGAVTEVALQSSDTNWYLMRAIEVSPGRATLDVDQVSTAPGTTPRLALRSLTDGLLYEFRLYTEGAYTGWEIPPVPVTVPETRTILSTPGADYALDVVFDGGLTYQLTQV